MAIHLETLPGYDPHYVKDQYELRGWQAEFVRYTNVDLREADQGAAVVCGDGRADEAAKKLLGPRMFGGVNAVTALKTGGNLIGFALAAKELQGIGYNPGTHGDNHRIEVAANEAKPRKGCGAYYLWEQGKLSSALHRNELPFEIIQQYGMTEKQWIALQMKLLGGKHFTYDGNHREKKVRQNPFLHTTGYSQVGDRFRVDDWALGLLGIPTDRINLFNAEIVEQLKPDARKIELLVR